MLTVDVVKQLQAILPQLTDDFSEKVAIDSASQVANDLTIGATLGFIPTVNSSIVIEDLKLINIVASEEVIGTTIKLTFTKKHDVTLTKGYEQVYLTNTDSGKDGLYDLLEAGELTLIIDTTETGFTSLIETRTGFNGQFKVKSSALDEITVDLGFTNTLSFYVADAFIKYGSRIYGMSIVDDIQKYLTTKPAPRPATTGKPFIWVLNAGENTDSDKSTASDMTAPRNAGSGFKIANIKNIDVIAVYPSNNSVGGFEFVTKCEQLKILLDKCLMGLALPIYTQVNSKDVLMPLSNEPLSFDKSFYSHLYSYQTVYYENELDGVLSPSYKFQEFELNYHLSFDEYDEIKKKDIIKLANEE